MAENETFLKALLEKMFQWNKKRQEIRYYW